MVITSMNHVLLMIALVVWKMYMFLLIINVKLIDFGIDEGLLDALKKDGSEVGLRGSNTWIRWIQNLDLKIRISSAKKIYEIIL